MAEPASRLPEEDRPVTRPDLRAQEGIGSNVAGGRSGGATSGTGASSGGASSGTSASAGGATSGTGNGLYNADSDSVGSLKDAEGSPDGDNDNRVGKGYSPGNSNSTSKLRSRYGITRKRAIIAGGAIAGVAGSGVVIFFLLIPLKIEHIVSNLEHRFFATSQNAVQKETQTMFEKYIAARVIPGYRRCGTTISKRCSALVVNGSSNPVANLYNSWSNARLENKLATNYGIEFKYNRTAKTWYLKAPGTDAKGDNIGHDGSGLDNEFQRADRAAMRSAVGDAMQNETRWKQVMYRFKVGRLLEEKYGIKRCIIFCGVKDTLAGKVDAQKTAAKLYLVQRVIAPRTESLGIVLECLLTSCDATQTQPTTAQDGTTGELSGAPENAETDAAVRTKLEELAQKYGSSITADELLSSLKTIQDQGYQKYLLQVVLEKIGLSDLSGQIADATPIVGWVNKAAKTITFINNSGPTLKKLAYLTNAAAAASLYMEYRTYADEIHTGHVNATEVGSMVNSLGPGNSGPSTDPIVGGTAGAEATPLYHSLISGGSSGSQTSLINSLLPAQAYAASSSSTSTGSSDYKCAGGNGGTPVPAGKLVCPEEVLGNGNDLLNGVHAALNTAPLSYITSLAGAWCSVVCGIFGTLGSVFSSIVSNIPGLNGLVSDVSSFVGQIAQPFFKFLTDQLIPNPFGSNMSGGRTFDMAAAGADVSGNDYAHTGLGGQALTPTQTADIINQQQNEEQQVFSHESFFARMFSTDSQYSLVSRVAMDIPFGIQSSAGNSFASLLSSPFSALSHSFASIFSVKASAATAAQSDSFGVTQYGYPNGVPPDPETYWDQHCSDNASQAYQSDADYKNNSWNQAAANYNTDNPNDPSGMPVNTDTNPCMLIKATVGSAGGNYDTSLLTTDDTADINSGSGSSAGSTAGGFTNPFPGGWTPNRLDMGYDGTFKNQIVSPCDGKMLYSYPDTGHDDNGGWKGAYFVVQCSQAISDLPSNAFYFAEGVSPTVPQDQSVTAGQQIGVPGWTGYSEGPGGIEWGLANPASPRETWAAHLGDSCTSGSPSQTFVLSFAKWVEQNLGVAAPSSTDNAGCA